MSILECENVSISYITGDFREIGFKEYVLRRIKHDYHVKQFWADKNISFKIERGDMLGIIGSNGAGKSTLLKAISGIMVPTEGRVHREGNIAALLELGSGFDGELTVKENAYLRGAMLGYTREFMDETYVKIIEFSELQDFQDRPFKQLSSGMKSRLAFSIASMVNPDILILDEVLSVGDGAFRKKSEDKMKEIIGSGTTTILVSHSLSQVSNMCNKVLWLEKGEQIAFGDTKVICRLYQQFLDKTIELAEAKRMLSALSDHYDYLVVGAGIYGATFAHEMAKAGKKCLVLDNRKEIAGNAHCIDMNGITVHKYGPHIFHTNDKEIWDFANSMTKFKPYKHTVSAKYQEQFYPLPINLTTFNKLWDVTSLEEAKERIQKQREDIPNPKNLEEAALAAVGKDLYEKFIRPPVEKEWVRSAKQLPASLISMFVRFDDEDGFYDDTYQGIPEEGYDALAEALLKDSSLVTGLDYDDVIHAFPNIADNILFTGSIDKFYNYSLGHLEYRTMRIEEEIFEEKSFQNRPEVVNCDAGTEHTRTIEYKYISGEKPESPYTIIQRLYPVEWSPGKPAYYPLDNEKNRDLYERYVKLWKQFPKGLPADERDYIPGKDMGKEDTLFEKEERNAELLKSYDPESDKRPNVYFGGRLGTYHFYTMAEAMKAAIKQAKELSARMPARRFLGPF